MPDRVDTPPVCRECGQARELDADSQLCAPCLWGPAMPDRSTEGPPCGRVYVDRLPSSGWGRWNGGAHMLANDLYALHAMADRIGLKRAWFQGDKTFAHYDLTASKRALAVAAGAVEIELGELPDDVLMRCKDGTYEQRCIRMARREAARNA